jgi:hypothetical protein
MFEYPSVVSRTLDPAGKSLLTVVALHDHEISDADVNLIQDLQGYKRHQVLKDGPATSGCLTWSPFVYNTSISSVFVIPSFDVLFNGEEVTVTGYLSADQALNQVLLPSPVSWPGVDVEQARIYVVFLELWYQALDPTTGAGYYSITDPVTGAISNYFWPYGCVRPDPGLYESMPDDSVDIFGTLTAGGGLYTTQRAQVQWSLNIQRVGLSYDFKRYRYGLDPVGTGPLQAVYAQASQASPITVDASYQFQNLGAATGDTGLWRAGNGNPNNALGTMDGYSYAMPVAVVFQRNTGIFSLGSNIFGCASARTSNSGTLATGVSGRFDSRLADQVFPDDTVDTRQSVSLDGWDYGKLAGEGLTDLITGSLRSAIGRGQPPGMNPYDLGSALDYYVSIAPSIVANTNTVGAFDGFMNGFSSDQRTFYVTKQVSVYGTPSTPQNPDGSSGTIGKSVGTVGAAWSQNDAFTVCLPSASSTISASAVISSAFVQGFNTPVGGRSRVPITLLSGQVLVQGLNSRTVVVSFPQNLYGTAYDPGTNNLYVTLGITYPAGSSASLVNIPVAMDGGSLYDGTTGKTLPVYGVSEYAIQAQQISSLAYQVWAYNPEYSSVQFGTRVWVRVAGSTGVQQTVVGGVTTTFIVPVQGINGQVNGLYVVGAWDLATGTSYSISGRMMSGTNCIVTIQAPVPSASTVVMSFIAQDTAQVAYNPSVKGVTQVEETVLFGTYAKTPSSPANSPSLWADSRVVVESVSYDNVSGASTVVLAGNHCIIKGISGNDVGRLVWVQDQFGNLNAVNVSTASFSNGYAIVVVPHTNLDPTQGGSTFLFVGSILPAFSTDSSLTVEERYVPYQGEGVEGHSYEVLYASDSALITTNGTGTAPVIGLSDVFPYNRQIPISTTLPSQVGWSDATLSNTPLATLFDSNFVAMRQNNVETVFEAPLHTNDFIMPVNRDIRKQVQLLQGGSGGRGFAKALPHLGFAIEPPAPKTVLGQNLQSTTAPIVLYVNNASGNDNSNGLSRLTAKRTITGAVNSLPPVLRHPCSIQLITTGVPYVIANISSSLQIIALGDGTLRTAKWYALANLAFSIQEEGRVVITSTADATSPIVIDGTGWAGFGDGPTSAFFVNSSRVMFNNIQFQGFVNPAVYGIDSDVEFVGCIFRDNSQAGGFEQGSGVIMTGGGITLPTGGNGFVLSQSELTASGVTLAVAAGASPGSFFTAERSSCVNLSQHQISSQEAGILPTTVVAYAQLNSSIVVDKTFQTAGEAVLTANSILARSVNIDPFLGGINADSTSAVVTQL